MVLAYPRVDVDSSPFDAIPRLHPKLAAMPSGSVDLATMLNCLHNISDMDDCLAQLQRVLRPGALLLAGWNDRDTSHAFVREVEDLIVSLNPHYKAHHALQDPEGWARKFTARKWLANS